MLKKIDKNYDSSDRSHAIGFLEDYRARGEVVTGLLYIDAQLPEMHELAGSSDTPMNKLEWSQLNPGSEELANLAASLR